MLLTGMSLLAVSPLWVALSPSIASLMTLQVLAGLGQLVAVVAAQSLVATFGDGSDRERNFGWYGAFVSGGQLLGPVLGGVLVDLAGFRAAFAVSASIAGVGVVAFASLPFAPRPARSASAAPAPRELLALTKLPTVQVSLWVSAAVMVVLTSHNSFLPAYLDEFAVPASVIGTIISSRSLASIVVRPFMATIVAHLGGRFLTFLVTIFASALGVAGLALGTHIAVLLISSLILGLSVGIAQPLTMVAVVEEVATNRHGVALGTRITTNRLVQFVAPIVLGLVAQVINYAVMFQIASLCVAAAAILLISRREVYSVIDKTPQR